MGSPAVAPLPSGFTLDPPQGAAIPPGAAPGGAGAALPPGFSVDGPTRPLDAPDPAKSGYAGMVTQMESGGKIGAVNPNSGAAGLYQFTPSTAAQYGLSAKDLTNPDPAVQQKVRSAFDQFTNDNAQTLSKNLGRDPNPQELYLAHQQGATGATLLLKTPDAKAVDALLPAYAGSKDPYGAATAAIVQNGGNPDMTAGDFAKLQEQRLSKAATKAMPFSAVKGVSAILPDDEIGPQVLRGKDAQVAAILGKKPGATRPADPVTNWMGHFLIGAAHNAVDVPLNSLSQGLGWTADKINEALGIGPQQNVAGLIAGTKPQGEFDKAVGKVDQYNQLYNLTNSANQSGGGWGNATGAIGTAMLTPELGLLKGAGFAPAVGRGLLGGAAFGAEQNSATGNPLAQDVAINSVLGGVGSGILYPAAKGVAALGSKLFPRAAGEAAPAVAPSMAGGQRIEPTFGPPAAKPPISPVVPGSLADLSAAAKARQANFNALGLKGESGPTMGMLGRDPTQWQIEQDTAAQAGKGLPLVQRFQNINAGLKAAIDKIHSDIGGTATTPYEAGQGAATALTSKWQEMQQGSVAPAYAAVMKADNVLPKAAYEELLQSNPLFPAAIKAVRADPVIGASVAGMEDSSLPVLDLAKRHLDDIANSATRAGSSNRARIASDAADALKAKLDKAFPGYAEARGAAEARFGEFDTKTMSGIQRGTIEPDDVIKKTLWTGKVADVDALKNALLTGTPEQIARGTAAWNDLRGQTMDRLIAAGFGEDGAGKFSPAAFNRAITKTFGIERLQRIFTPDEMTALKQIQMAGNDAFSDVPFSSVNHSHSGTFLANEGVPGIAAKLLKGVNKTSDVAGAFAPMPHTLVTRPMEGVMDRLGAKTAVRGALNPDLDASVAAAARRRASAKIVSLLNRLPTSQASAALYNQRSGTNG